MDQSVMRLSLNSVWFLHRIHSTNQPMNKLRFSHQVLQRVLSSYSDQPPMVSARQSQAHPSLLLLKMRQRKHHLQHPPGRWRPSGGYTLQGCHGRAQGAFRHFASDQSGHGDDISSSSENAASPESSRDKMSYIEARKKGVIQRRRSLLPMERVGGMLETDLDSEEVLCQPPSEMVHLEDEVSANVTGKSHSSVPRMTDPGVGSTAASNGSSAAAHQSGNHQNGLPMIDGEMVIALKENFKRHEFLTRFVNLFWGFLCLNLTLLLLVAFSSKLNNHLKLYNCIVLWNGGTTVLRANVYTCNAEMHPSHYIGGVHIILYESVMPNHSDLRRTRG